MITPPPDWKRSAGPQLVTLRPPGGGGRIRYFPRRAVRPFSALVAETLADEPGFEETGRRAPQRLLTIEGEYGACIEITGRLGGRAARRVVAAVLLDDFAAVLDGLAVESAAESAIGTTTRELVVGARFGLGLRPRRFLHRRPAGWQALANGLEAAWTPPGFPRHRAQIVVYPAEPSSATPARVFDDLLADEERRGFTRAGRVGTESLVGRDGLVGVLCTCAGRWASEPLDVDRATVVWSDRRNQYVVRLESAAPARLDEDRAVLRDLAMSVEALPHRGAGGFRADAGSLVTLGDPWAE